MKDKIELLAPAGNMDSLKAAAAAGCDAVYLGLQSFSARAFAGNFSHDEFIEAIAYCHIRDIKIYVTINTMLFETEIENAKKEVQFLYDNDVDGLLIQDLGLFHYVRTCYPDLDVHCSTQMHIHNLVGVNFMKEQGASRVVMARETPIETIKEACRTGVQIEVFVYGAICISYSGQCLMSSVTKNRSANRGMCAQCCRLKYYPEGRKEKDGEYLLSPKDLNVIDHLPELIEAGVASLKIEGRMKRPEYVWLVTKTFREAIDAYYAGRKYKVDAERLHELLLMFNRGFSQGHLLHADTADRMSHYRPNHQGVEIGTVLQYRHGRVQIKLSGPLYQHDGLRILNTPVDTGLTAVKIYDAKDNLVNHAEAGQIVWLDCHDEPNPRPGQKLHKTSDAQLLKTIDDEILQPVRRIPVTMEYHAEIGRPFQLTVHDGSGHEVSADSEMDVQEAKTAPLNSEKIEACLRKLGDSPYEISSVIGTAGNIFLPVSAVNEVRRKAMELLSKARAKRHIRNGAVAYHAVLHHPQKPAEKTIVACREPWQRTDEGTGLYPVGYGSHELCPVVNQSYDVSADHDHAVLSSYCDLAGSHQACICGMTMNIANSYAMAYVYSLGGIDGIIVSSEMSDDNIKLSQDAFTARYGFVPYLYQFTYGKRTIMYIKDGFMADHHAGFITDIQNSHYEIENNNGTVELLEPDVQYKENPYCFGEYVIVKNQREYLDSKRRNDL